MFPIFTRTPPGGASAFLWFRIACMGILISAPGIVAAAPPPPKAPQQISFFGGLIGNGVTKVIATIGPFSLRAQCNVVPDGKQIILYVTSAVNGWFLSGGSSISFPIPANELVMVADASTGCCTSTTSLYMSAPRSLSIVAPDGSYLGLGFYGLGLNMINFDCHVDGTVVYFKATSKQLQSPVP